MAAIRPQATIEPRCNLANIGTCRKEQALIQDAGSRILVCCLALQSSTGSALSACIATVQYSVASIVLACNVHAQIEL
jgi:hypothetical protein